MNRVPTAAQVAFVKSALGDIPTVSDAAALTSEYFATRSSAIHYMITQAPLSKETRMLMANYEISELAEFFERSNLDRVLLFIEHCRLVEDISVFLSHRTIRIIYNSRLENFINYRDGKYPILLEIPFPKFPKELTLMLDKVTATFWRKQIVNYLILVDKAINIDVNFAIYQHETQPGKTYNGTIIRYSLQSSLRCFSIFYTPIANFNAYDYPKIHVLAVPISIYHDQPKPMIMGVFVDVFKTETLIETSRFPFNSSEENHKRLKKHLPPQTLSLLSRVTKNSKDKKSEEFFKHLLMKDHEIYKVIDSVLGGVSRLVAPPEAPPARVNIASPYHSTESGVYPVPPAPSNMPQNIVVPVGSPMHFSGPDPRLSPYYARRPDIRAPSPMLLPPPGLGGPSTSGLNPMLPRPPGLPGPMYQDYGLYTPGPYGIVPPPQGLAVPTYQNYGPSTSGTAPMLLPPLGLAGPSTSGPNPTILPHPGKTKPSFKKSGPSTSRLDSKLQPAPGLARQTYRKDGPSSSETAPMVLPPLSGPSTSGPSPTIPIPPGLAKSKNDNDEPNTSDPSPMVLPSDVSSEQTDKDDESTTSDPSPKISPPPGLPMPTFKIDEPTTSGPNPTISPPPVLAEPTVKDDEPSTSVYPMNKMPTPAHIPCGLPIYADELDPPQNILDQSHLSHLVSRNDDGSYVVHLTPAVPEFVEDPEMFPPLNPATPTSSTKRRVFSRSYASTVMKTMWNKVTPSRAPTQKPTIVLTSDLHWTPDSPAVFTTPNVPKTAPAPNLLEVPAWKSPRPPKSTASTSQKVDVPVAQPDVPVPKVDTKEGADEELKRDDDDASDSVADTSAVSVESSESTAAKSKRRRKRGGVRKRKNGTVRGPKQPTSNSDSDDYETPSDSPTGEQKEEEAPAEEVTEDEENVAKAPVGRAPVGRAPVAGAPIGGAAVREPPAAMNNQLLVGGFIVMAFYCFFWYTMNLPRDPEYEEVVHEMSSDLD